MTEFEKRVYSIVRTIKAGQVMSYAQVAKAVGSPRAARAVGNALSKNADPNIPCHRVIRRDGRIGGYNMGAELKIKLLRNERVVLNPKS